MPGVGPTKLDYHSNSEQKEFGYKTPGETFTRLSFFLFFFLSAPNAHKQAMIIVLTARQWCQHNIKHEEEFVLLQPRQLLELEAQYNWLGLLLEPTVPAHCKTDMTAFSGLSTVVRNSRQ